MIEIIEERILKTNGDVKSTWKKKTHQYCFSDYPPISLIESELHKALFLPIIHYHYLVPKVFMALFSAQPDIRSKMNPNGEGKGETLPI